MGQMCCTKYGEDGQNALMDSKQKNPEKRPRGKKNGIQN